MREMEAGGGSVMERDNKEKNRHTHMGEDAKRYEKRGEKSKPNRIK